MTATLSTDVWDLARIERKLGSFLSKADPMYRPAMAIIQRCNTMPGALSTLGRVRRFIVDMHLRRVEPLAATRDDLQDWVTSMTGLAPETVSGYIGAARMLYEEAIDRDLIARNPARRLTAGRYRPPQIPALPKAEAEQLLQAIGAELDDEKTRLAAARDNFIFTLGLTMGPRASEILRLEVGDLRLAGDPPVATLFGKNRSHQAKRPSVLVVEAYQLWTKELASYLGRDLRPDDALVISLSHNARKAMRENPDLTLTPMSRAALYCLVRERLRDGQLTGVKLGTHRLRKTAATLMYEADVDIDTIRRTLDHADVSTTFRNYIIPAQDLRRAAGDQVGLRSGLDRDGA